MSIAMRKDFPSLVVVCANIKMFLVSLVLFAPKNERAFRLKWTRVESKLKRQQAVVLTSKAPCFDLSTSCYFICRTPHLAFIVREEHHRLDSVQPQNRFNAHLMVD